MSFFSIVFYGLVFLGILIFVHELGHFIFAKLMRVKVLKFSLGFGPKIIGAKSGDTEYQISAMPLGGYVKMLGEEPGETLSDEDRKVAFNYQPAWKRFLIILAGPAFNLVFAAVLFYFIFLAGIPTGYPDVGEVVPGTPAEAAGLMKGDRILEIDGTAISNWDDMTGIIYTSAGKPLKFKIKRGDSSFEKVITPEKKVEKTILEEDIEIGQIGIGSLGNTYLTKFGPAESLGLSLRRTYEVSVLTLVIIKKLILRDMPADKIGGPILIFKMAGKQASEGALKFFMSMAIISINLGIINLFPIPILDGGHILFIGIESVRRRPLSENAMAVAQRIGLALLLALMAFAFYNDIIKIVTGQKFP